MATITFKIPEDMDVAELVKVLGKAGVVPEIDELDDNELIPLDVATVMAFPDMTHDELIGAKLRLCRQEAKLTQKAIAELVGEDSANISAMERGKRPVSKSMAKKLGKALNVTYHTFL